MRIDLMKDLKAFYTASAKEPAIVDVPAMRFLMVDGTGDPNESPEYQQAVEALYTLSYGLKFAIKKSHDNLDYSVMPLQGLWWADDMATFMADRRAWRWTMMIAQPEFVSRDLLKQVLEQARKKKALPALARVRLETFHEGPAAQIMHIGPYAAEGPTVEKLHQFIADQGYVRAGKHHEIYLSDPRRSAPERMRTIIRQAVRRA